MGVTNCPELVEIQGLEQSESVEHIYIDSCPSLKELPDLSGLKILEICICLVATCWKVCLLSRIWKHVVRLFSHAGCCLAFHVPRQLLDQEGNDGQLTIRDQKWRHLIALLRFNHLFYL